MNILIPVGLIALGVIGWEVYQYRDWVGPVGIAIIYVSFCFLVRACGAAMNATYNLTQRLRELGISDDEIERIANN